MTKKVKKKKRPGCLGCLGVILVLGIISSALGSGKQENTQQTKPTTTTVSSSTENSESSQSSSSETKNSGETLESTLSSDTSEPIEKPAYDIGEMNVKITDSFIESIEFNQSGEDGYEWTAFIDEIKLKENGAINTIVNDEFLLLSEAEKTEVLNHVSSSTNMVVFLETEIDKPYFITAYDKSGNKVAQSHMTNFLKYKFQ